MAINLSCMGIRRICLLLILCLVLFSFGTATAADTYATERLRTIVEQIPTVNPSQLRAGKIYHFDYQNNSIVIRVNEWGEVEHAGFQMFDEVFRQHSYVPVCDFIERYFLELSQLPPSSVKQRLQMDDVILENGLLEDFVSMAQGAEVTLQSLEFTQYRAVWKNGARTLVMLFPMDYQLISGCNAIELEKNYLRNILRYRPKGRTTMAPDVPVGYDKEFFLQAGGTYLAESVRHDLYYRMHGGKWELFCDPKKPEWSAFNLALSPVPVGGRESGWTLQLELDQYGYQSTPVSVPMSRWVAFCEDGDGTPYFTVKETSGSGVKGVVFVPNERGGYCHMLSIEIPMKAMEEGTGIITGRLYVYVPLHNIDKDFFKLK